jgi:hypothetical protein
VLCFVLDPAAFKGGNNEEVRPELRVDAQYRNTNNWKDRRDEFNMMFRSFADGKGIPNAGGFRYRRTIGGAGGIDQAAFVLLTTTLSEAEWPDRLDLETGIFTYYGDNRTPGKSIRDTSQRGNQILENTFEKLHLGRRNKIPPFLIFQRLTEKGNSFMRFLGLAVPGADGLTSLDDLVAIWRFQHGRRFQNYRSVFTVLAEEIVPWSWLDDIVRGMPPCESTDCPKRWKSWALNGRADALQCATKKIPRSKAEQDPHDSIQKTVLDRVLTLTDRQFEFAAKQIVSLLDNRFTNLMVTPKVRDHGRDVVGKYEIGESPLTRSLEVFVEAKRWTVKSSVGVKPVARLLSRMRHRDVGVFVTTSFFDRGVQQELIDDGHPIILVSGGDIARLLISRDIGGVGHEERLEGWLNAVRSDAGSSSE